MIGSHEKIFEIFPKTNTVTIEFETYCQTKFKAIITYGNEKHKSIEETKILFNEKVISEKASNCKMILKDEIKGTII